MVITRHFREDPIGIFRALFTTSFIVCTAAKFQQTLTPGTLELNARTTKLATGGIKGVIKLVYRDQEGWHE